MKRYDIINKLIEKNKYTSYLEIGTQYGDCFTKIDCKYKECVDPVKVFSELTHNMTSNEFFEQNKKKFDIIFVDGLHTEDQTLYDINESLKILKENGIIVVHDCLPHCEEFTQICWNGTVFRSIIELRYTNKNISISVVDTDCGCGLISNGDQSLFDKVPIEDAKTFYYYNKNKKDLMNVISIDEFLEKYIIR